MTHCPINIHKAILASSLPSSISFRYIINRDVSDIIITGTMVQAALENWEDHEDVLEELRKVSEVLDKAQATMIVLDDREVTLEGVESFYHRLD